MENEKKPTKLRYWIAGVISALCVAFWGYTYFHFNALIDPKQITSYGVFGDSFGGINALFSGLAFIGVVFALLLQHEDQIGSEKEHKQNLAVQERIAVAQIRAAEANERTATLQEEIGKTQQKILEAQALTAQYTHALVNQQKATVWVQSIHAQINALTSILSTRQIALQQFQMPETLGHPEKMVSYMGRPIPVSQFRTTVSEEINTITGELANLRQELINGTRSTSGGANA